MPEYQHELFDEVDKKKKKKKRFKKHLFDKDNLRFTLTYEQVGLFIIFFVVLLSIIFTLGVERGKNLVHETKEKKNFKREIKQVTKDKKRSKVERKVDNKKKKDKKKKETGEQISRNYFSIQVVSYKKDSLVKQECEILEKKGYTPIVVDTGNYKHIYIGKFKKRKEAKKLLEKLKRIYSDCFIKKIKGGN